MLGMSERDEVTLRVLAIIEDTTFADQRRQAVQAYAAWAREDPRVAEIVRLMLASRRARTRAGNVIRLPGARR